MECVDERGAVTSFNQTYNGAEITKHSIPKDVLRDRQTSEATFLFREGDASSWGNRGSDSYQVLAVHKQVPGTWKADHRIAGKSFTRGFLAWFAFMATAETSTKRKIVSLT